MFALLSTVSQFFGAPVDPAASTGALISGTSRASINIAIVLDSLTYLFSAAMIYFSRHLIPAFVGERTTNRGIFSLVREGISFVKNSRIMRAIYIGILGAFGAGGLVAGVAQAYVATLGAGNAGYGILFGTVFTGLALGMLIGPKVLPTVPRRMVFTLSIGFAGVSLVIMALLQDFLGAVLASAVMGLFAGIAWITGFTMIGQEVADQLRGRVFAFVMSSVRVILLATIALGPILAGALGSHLITVGSFQMYLSGPAIVLSVGGLVAVLVSLYAGRQVGGLAGSDAAPGVRPPARRPAGGRRSVRCVDRGRGSGHCGRRPVRRDVVRLLERGRVVGRPADRAGIGRVGRRRSRSRPGARSTHPRPHCGRSPISPTWPPTDYGRPWTRGRWWSAAGYVDAVVVRFGAEGGLDEGRILRMAQWATGGLRPDLTLLVDQVPVDGAGRRPAEAETLHRARRHPPSRPGPTRRKCPVDPAQAYRDLAASAPERYLVVDPLAPASGDLPAEVSARVDSTLRLRVPVKAGIRAA